MTVSEKKCRVVLKIFGMFTLIVVMNCSMAYIKCPCVIHTYCMPCTGDTELKSHGKWYL